MSAENPQQIPPDVRRQRLFKHVQTHVFGENSPYNSVPYSDDAEYVTIDTPEEVINITHFSDLDKHGEAIGIQKMKKVINPQTNETGLIPSAGGAIYADGSILRVPSLEKDDYEKRSREQVVEFVFGITLRKQLAPRIKPTK